jgi:hypothetical protein
VSEVGPTDRPASPVRSAQVILATKLNRPPVRPEHVARGQLLELLSAGASTG